MKSRLSKEIAKAFKKDIMLAPTVPTLAFKIGEKIDDSITIFESFQIR